jgi:hypothetical protein
MGKRESQGHALEMSVDSLSNALAGVGEVVANPASIDTGLATLPSAASPDGNNGNAEGSSRRGGDQSSARGDDWAISESQTAKDYESDKFGFWQAAAINSEYPILPAQTMSLLPSWLLPSFLITGSELALGITGIMSSHTTHYQ